MYSRISSTKSQSFFITNFNASLTNLTVLLSESRDCSYYDRRRILAPPPFRLQNHTDLRVQDIVHTPSGNISLGSVTLLAPEAGDIVELILLSSRFNIQKIYVLTTECIYTFCTVLRTNSYYFPKQQ